MAHLEILLLHVRCRCLRPLPVRLSRQILSFASPVLGFLRPFSSVPTKPVAYPPKPKDPHEAQEQPPQFPSETTKSRLPRRERDDVSLQEVGAASADAGQRGWTRRDVRFVKDVPKITPVSYPARVAPLPEDRSPPEAVEEGDRREGDDQRRREGRRIQSDTRVRSYFGLEQEEIVPFPMLIKVDKQPTKVPMDLAEAIRAVKVICLSSSGKGPQYRGLATATATSDPTNVQKPLEDASLSGEGQQSDDSRQTGPPKRSIRGGPVSWLSLALLIMTGGGLIFYYDREKKRHIEGLKSATSAVKQGPSVGTPAIGGPFKLVNHDGKSVTEKDFFGKWTLIYFGFTHCPDICPDELQKLAAAVDKIKRTAGLEIVPVFISVDPERDSVEQVHDYVKEFHKDLIGLTGTSSEIRQVARAYRVYYMKTEEEGSDYLVDHSIVMYLMDPNMNYVKFFGKNYDVDSLSEGIIKEIKQYK